MTQINIGRRGILAAVGIALAIVIGILGWQNNWLGARTRIQAAFATPAPAADSFAIAPKATTEMKAEAKGQLIVIVIGGQDFVSNGYTLEAGKTYTVVADKGAFYVADYAAQLRYPLVPAGSGAEQIIKLGETPAPGPIGGVITRSSTYTGTIDEGVVLEVGKVYTRLPFHYVGGRFVETATGKIITGQDVQRLNDEMGDAFVRRITGVKDASGAQITEPLDCPTGVICTVTMPNGKVQVFVGMGLQGRNALKLTEIAMTVRVIGTYTENDNVYSPCALAQAEDAFGKGEDPAFPAVTGNIACALDGSSFMLTNYDQARATANDPTMVSTPKEVAKLLLGAEDFAKYITVIDGTNGSGFKYEGPKATVTAPGFGEIIGDKWHFTNSTPKGTTQADVVVFSFYRDSTVK